MKGTWMAGVLAACGFFCLCVTAGAAESRFTDVPPDSPYAQAVEYCAEKSWLRGTGEERFSPGSPMTRAMFVQLLANRTAGYDAKHYNRYLGPYARAYKDVSPKAWYAAAVDWARETGLVRGVGGGRFEPERSLTREELAQLLYTYAYRTGDRTEGPAGEAGKSFEDFENCSPSVRDAVNWAVEQGLLTGYSGKLSPKSAVTRAQAALVLYRARDLIANDSIALLFDLDPEEVGKLVICHGSSGREHDVTDREVIQEVVEKFNSFRYSRVEENVRDGWTLAIEFYGTQGEKLTGATVFPDVLEFHTDLYFSSGEGAFPREWMQQMLEVPRLLELDPGLVESIELRGEAGEWREAAAEEQADILQRLNGFCPRTSYERTPAEGDLELVIRQTDGSAPLRLFLESSALVWNGVRYESYTGNCFPKVWRNGLLGIQELPFREDAVRKGEALFHFDWNDVESVVLDITDDHDGGGVWRMPEDAAQIGEAVKRLNAFRYTSTAKRTGPVEGGTYGIQLTGKRLTNWWYYIGEDFIIFQDTIYYAGDDPPCFTEEWLADCAYGDLREQD